MRLPNENEEFNADWTESTDSEVYFNLENKKGEQLVLRLTAIQNQRFRIRIEEHDGHRYKLETGFSLAEEPALSQ